MSLSIVERDASRFNIFLLHFTGVFFFLQFFFCSFPVFSFQFSCTFRLVQFTVSGKRGRTTFKFSVSLSLSLTHKIAKFVLSSATTNNIYVRAAAASGVLKVHVAVAELSNVAALCKVSFFMLPNSMSEAGSILTFTCT